MPTLRVLWIFALSIASAVAGTAAPADPAAPPNAPAGLSMTMMSSIAYEELYDALKKYPQFATMDKEKPGSPIIIRVSHSYGHTPAGTASNIASAILAGGTLGLLPAFSNRDLVVTYDVLVNETLVTSYSYSKNVTRVFNIHSTDKTHGLGADGLAWVTGTASQFAADLARDPAYAGIQAEYLYYYGTAPIAAIIPTTGGPPPSP
jgi:hypothetical protein